MGNTINRRVLVLSALLMAALVLMSAIGLEDAQAAKKVTLCHDAGQETQKTIKVSKEKAKKHLAHGDTRGKCTPLASLTPAPAPANCNQSPAYSGESSAWAWGQGEDGQLGDGYNFSWAVPMQVKGEDDDYAGWQPLSGLRAIDAGVAHSLALKEDCTVVAWGENFKGQLGDGSTEDRNTPVQVQNLSGVKAVAAGAGHSLALKEDGTVFAWGNNVFGQLGDGTTTERHTPVQVQNLSGVKAIAAGDHHSLALKEDGTVFAWGNNYYGYLGDGTTTSRTTPVQVQNLSGVKAIDAGRAHTLALKEDGTVFAWGFNVFGQLGDWTATSRTTPVQVKGDPPTNAPVSSSSSSSSSAAFFPWDTWDNNLSGVKAISAGEYHSLALKEDGTVFAWGSNEFGQLGDGTTTYYRTTLVQVQNLSGVKAVAAGAGHSLALKEDGTVFAWGHNEYGQLGNNRGHPHETDDYETERRTPVQVMAGLDDVEAISTSGNHSLAKVVKPPVAQP